MKPHRKRARDYLQSIRTVSEFDNYLNSLALTEQQKQIAKDIYIKGLSYVQLASKYNCSVETIKKEIKKVQDKAL